VNAREQIEALVAHSGRGPGTDAERRAALDLSRRLEAVDRTADIEPFEARPAYALVHLIHALLAIAGSVVATSAPVVGAALVAVAVALTFGDASGLFMLSRRLTGMRASQNVTSMEDGGKPGTLVLVAHYDAARRHHERLALLPVFFGSMVALLVCAVARIPGLEGVVLTAVQFVPTVVLVVSVPLLADIALSDFVTGANNNASGVATVVRLAERYGGALQHFDVWILLTGAHPLGMRAFAKRHRKDLSKERTVFLNLDEVGTGSVRFSRRAGLLFASRSHVQLVELCEGIAEDDEGVFEAGSFVYRAPPNRYPAITISCRPAEDEVDDQALERAFGFCCELVERLDAAIGPDLERDDVSEEPVPSG
jgi:hypothetical protein